MTTEEMDFIGSMNMCGEISNEAYKKIMCHCEKTQPCEDCISRADVKKYLSAPDSNGDRVIYESDLDLLPSVTPKAERKAILDKIKAEIEQKQYDFMDDKDYDEGIRFGLMLAYQTVDKYKAESEDKE